MAWRFSFFFILFFILSACLYRGTADASRLDDFVSGIIPFIQLGWSGWWDSFGFPSLYYGHNLIFYGFYSLFGLQAHAWHYFLLGLFSLNSTLLLFFFYRMANDMGWKNPRQTAAAVSALWICSPYLSENVIWAATLHYQLAMASMWITLYVLRKAFLQKNIRYTLPALIIWSISLTCHEISLVFPGIWVIYLFFLAKRKHQSATSFITGLSLLSFGMIVLYFFLTFLREGQWMPHYGTEVHLAHLQLSTLFSAYGKYLLKILAGAHFLSYEQRTSVYALADQKLFLFGFVAGVVAFYSLFPGWRKLLQSVFMLSLLAFCALFPVLNMFFMILLPVENDRLAFLAMPFIYAIPALLLQYIPLFSRYLLVAGLLTISVSFQQQIRLDWILAAAIQQNAVNTWQWENASKVFVLNNPQNVNGVYVFRDNSRLGDALLVFRGVQAADQYVPVAGLNFIKPDDGVNVNRLDSLTIRIDKNAWGWFWHNRVGATDYETPDYSFELHEKGYELRFKRALRPDEHIVFLNKKYCWEEVR